VNRAPFLPAVLLLALAGCGDAGGAYVSFPAYAAGVRAEPFRAGVWTVTLERAEVAFGPAYFCATASSDAELCAEAIAEFRSSVRVDALDPAPRAIGTIDATLGEVRSAIFDYGISWWLPDPAPRPTAGAIEGHSAVFAGRARRDDGAEVRFTAAIDIEPRLQGAHAVFGVRTRHAITGSADALLVRFDPTAWWRRVDFDALAAEGGDAADPIVVRPRTQAWDALTIGMTSNAPPGFAWGAEAAPE
jgi:hypothetical protein